jgi:hypothetical protein
MTALQGSCLCGGVRFEIDGPLMRFSHCHCRQCQKAHGGPFRTRARVAADFRFLAGEKLVSFFESTPGTHRGFCKVCGAPVLVKFDERSRSARTDPGAVALYGVALATLDDDPGVRPDAHAFIIDKAPWFAVTDDLPQYQARHPVLPPNSSPEWKQKNDIVRLGLSKNLPRHRPNLWLCNAPEASARKLKVSEADCSRIEIGEPALNTYEH